MISDKSSITANITERYKILFFAGGETRENRFNIFTGSFIRMMQEIAGDDFDFIRGIYFRTPMMNVIWALNHAQRPLRDPENQRITAAAFRQITTSGISPETRLVLISSSSGSIAAAQTACYLAEENMKHGYFKKPFHLVLGASMVDEGSALYTELIRHQKEGMIGTIIHDEIQDEDDNSRAIGGLSRLQAYRNAFGLMFPILSKKFKGPSFLNTHPEKGHLHRRRSQSTQKALDYIDIIMVRNRLAGNVYMEKAIAFLNSRNS